MVSVVAGSLTYYLKQAWLGCHSPNNNVCMHTTQPLNWSSHSPRLDGWQHRFSRKRRGRLLGADTSLHVGNAL